MLAIPCDLTKYDEVEEMTQTVRQRLGQIDILANNAGVIEVGPLESMTLADFEEALRVNFYGALHAMLAVIPEMRERGAGRIVNISSIGGKIAVPHLVPYTASKFALNSVVTGSSSPLSAPD